MQSHVGVNRAKDTQGFAQADVVITTYGTLRNDIDLFSSFTFDVVLLDESQFIKNPTSQLAKRITQLDATIRITLTGTPIENTILDLWSQMNFVNPGLLGNHKFFIKEYVQPIEKLANLEKSDELQNIIKPFVMRRTKFQVAHDLPPKTEQIIFCDMTEEQEDVYEKTKVYVPKHDFGCCEEQRFSQVKNSNTGGFNQTEANCQPSQCLITHCTRLRPESFLK